MKVYFLRHGQAGDRTEWTRPDEERPLTDEGRAQTARGAAAVRRLGLVPELILTSPLVRARQTAEVLARELGCPERVVIDERVGPGFRRKTLREILREQKGRGNLMVVGHEPDFSEVVGRLVGDARVVMKKGGLAIVEITDDELLRGRLLALATPEMLEAGVT